MLDICLVIFSMLTVIMLSVNMLNVVVLTYVECRGAAFRPFIFSLTQGTSSFESENSLMRHCPLGVNLFMLDQMGKVRRSNLNLRVI